MLMTILATIVVLGVIIFVHEMGHFVAAKLVGIEVVRFSLGLGPKLLGFKRGETEYVLSWVPLGGYVKMGGMDDEVMEMLEGGETRARQPGERDFDAKPVWARAIVVSAGVIMNVVFALAVYTAVIAFWGVPEPATLRVGHIDVAMLPEGADALATLPVGSEVSRIAGRPIQRWSDIGEALSSAPAGPTTIELASGPVVTVRIPENDEARARLTGAILPWQEAVISGVNPGDPADRAGIREGDRVVAVDGSRITTWYQFQDAIRGRPESAVDLTIERGGRELVRSVTPNAERTRDPETGEEEVVGIIGVFSSPEIIRVHAGPLTAASLGVRQTYGMTVLILDFLRDLLTGQVSRRSVGSIVAIGEISGRVARQGIESFLGFLAFFSVNLAILNLLPIPILDGGHLLFLGIELVRGRALSLEQRVRWSHVGFIIVVGLMLWALSNDVLRLLGL